MVHETVKMGADNPDNYYFNAQISGEFEYKITGKRNSAHYIGFFTQNGNYGTTGGLHLVVFWKEKIWYWKKMVVLKLF